MKLLLPATFVGICIRLLLAEFLLRDSAHATRRVLSRAWGACEVLSAILGLFVHDKNSPAQLIHHSMELRHLYRESCQSSTQDAAVTTVFKDMRAAKHRIETYVRPLSRCILNITGLIAFCTKVSIVRKGTQAGVACATTVEVLIIAAMMADAGVEVMMLIRVILMN